MIEDRWIEAAGVRLHYLAASGEPGLMPLAYMPGSLGCADDFRDEMKALAPRTTIAISPRGSGKSSAPRSGYSFAHRLSDLENLLAQLDLPAFCLMAYSLGVPIAVGYAARHTERVRGLILLDYPACYPERSKAWLAQALPFATERGIPQHVVRRIQAEAERVELWSELPSIAVPILVIEGGRSKALSGGDVERYRRQPHVEVVNFHDSGHEIHKPDYQRFLNTVQGFLRSLDGMDD